MDTAKTEYELLEQKLATLDIPYKYSKRVFYKKFAFRVKFRVMGGLREVWYHSVYFDPDKVMNNEINIHQVRRDRENQRAAFVEDHNKEVKAIRLALFAQYKDPELYKVRKSAWDGNNVYVNSAEAVHLLLSKFEDRIELVEGPRDDAHLEANGDRILEVRNNLWYKKYRYKLEYPGTTKFRESIQDIHTMFDDGVRMNKNAQFCIEEPRDGWFVRGYQICSIYFEHETDWLTWKMMCTETPSKVIEAVTFDELDK